MADLERVSFTIEPSLLNRLMKLMRKTKYRNRSEFIRDLVRSRLVEKEWQANEEALGTITLVYNHEQRELAQKLTATQHQHHDEVLASTHVHLDRHTCAEMIMVCGRANVIEHIAEELRKQKGVLHVSVSISSTGKRLV